MIDLSLLTLPVLHHTSHELVLVKPAGMAAELTSDPKGVSLISRVRRACSPPYEPKLPHRLDRVTRGIIVVALTPQAIAFHGEQIRSKKWEKYYLARVAVPHHLDTGALLGRHKAYLKRVRQRSKIVRSGGQPSFLEILAAHAAPGRPGQAHLLVKLLTGRFHQLRVMLAGLGVPLVDDFLYGDPISRHGTDFYLEHIVLKLVECASRVPCVVHLHADPQREPVAAAMQVEIDSLLRTLG
jgi:23S rRNA-/tRNA-specific pseudouridylate synthase